MAPITLACGSVRCRMFFSNMSHYNKNGFIKHLTYVVIGKKNITLTLYQHFYETSLICCLCQCHFGLLHQKKQMSVYVLCDVSYDILKCC